MPARERVEELRAAVVATPGVHDLVGGPFGAVATYLAGGRIIGLRVTETDAAEIHLAVTPERPLVETAEAVRKTAAKLGYAPVSVTIEDIVYPAEVATGNESEADSPAATGQGPQARGREDKANVQGTTGTKIIGKEQT